LEFQIMKNISLAALVAAMMLPGLAMAQDVSVSTEVSVSASGEVSVSTPDVSSALSSVSSELSSAVSSVSSELSSEMASSEMSSGEAMSCDTLDTSTMMLTAIDAAALAAVTSVTVFAVDDCSGLGGLAEIDGGAVATLQTNQMVTDALTAQGQAGGEVVAYMIDGTSLTVYVRSRT
jgi:hypothetical protein